jgi:4-hydroxy-tetrahydrodipicolinate synthase
MIKVESVPSGSFIQALNLGEPKLPAMVGYAGIMMIDALRRRAVGVQPGCSFIELYQTIWDFWSVGDFESAEALHRRLLPYISYWMQEMELIIQVEKTISKERGIISSDHSRRPSRSLDAEEKLSIARFLTEFEEYFQRS